MRFHGAKILTLNTVSSLLFSFPLLDRKQSFQSKFLPFPSPFSFPMSMWGIGLGLKYVPTWVGSDSEGMKRQAHPVTFLASISVPIN